MFKYCFLLKYLHVKRKPSAIVVIPLTALILRKGP